MKTLENIDKYLKEGMAKNSSFTFTVGITYDSPTDHEGYPLPGVEEKIKKDLQKVLKKHFKNVRISSWGWDQ